MWLLIVVTLMASNEPLQDLLNVEDTGRILGRGAFGEVVDMKLQDGTTVAGKKIHSIFFDPSNYSPYIKERFQQECVR